MTERAYTEFTPQKQRRFLKALAELPNVTRACTLARISRPTAYNHRRTDPEFEAAWEEALECGIERMEAEAMRRAVQGTKKPVYQQGKLVGYIQEYSDTLIIFLLKAHKPDRYYDRLKIEGGVSIEVVNRFIRKVEDMGVPASEAFEMYLQELDRARAEGSTEGSVPTESADS